MVVLGDELVFPEPSMLDSSEPLAIGGDLSVERLLLAYHKGIFAWQDSPPVWYSPHVRALLFPKDFVISKSLRKNMCNKGYRVSIDCAFDAVIAHCALAKRKNQTSTWITSAFIDSFNRLHEHGYAHSFEVWLNHRLVGGLYGISLGAMFSGESMFSLVHDASKIALATLVVFCMRNRLMFIDGQVYSAHLKSLGFCAVVRNDFLALLQKALQHETRVGLWKQDGFDHAKDVWDSYCIMG